MKSSRVLVAGGAGYIGSCMVRVLIDHGYEPIVFDNLSTGHRAFVPRGVDLVKGDLRDPKAVRAVFRRYRGIDAVMHFAACALVGESVEDPLKYFDNNVVACVTLLQAVAEARVKRFIFSSTCAVYGEPERVPIREEDPCRPVNPYGRSKRMFEEILKDVSTPAGFDYVCLRYFNACGAHDSTQVGEWHDPETHLIPNIFKTLTGEKKVVTIFGDDYDTPDGTCIRDYIHIKDLCQAHLLALRSMERGGGSNIFNLGNGEGYSVRQIIDAVEKVTGKKVRFKIGPRRPGDPARLVGDASKAARMLGWKPTCDLENIIASAWKWELARKKAV